MGPPPHLDRPLGTCERFYWLFDQASCTSFVIRTLLDRPLDVDALHLGFAAACLRHPALNSRIVVEGDAVRFRPREDEAHLEVTRLAPGADLAAELDRQLDTRFTGGPPLRVAWLDRPDGRAELLWTFDHATLDAGSASRLCLEILATAAGTAEPGPPMEAAPPQEALYPVRFGGLMAKLRFVLRTLVERLAGLFRPRPPALPGARADAGLVREILTTELLIDREAATDLRARARDEDTTIHGAICAATVLAASALVPGEAPVRWPIASAVDLRSRLDPPLAPEQLANVISMVATPTEVDPAAELWPVARAIRTDLRQRLDRGDGHALWALLPDSILKPGQASADKLLAMMHRNPISLIVTNLGALEHPDAPVQELSFAMGPQPGCALVLGVVSWRGQLRLCPSFNGVLIGEEARGRMAGDLSRLPRS
jgi:hypothetical protein